jgi:glycogen operon protein
VVTEKGRLSLNQLLQRSKIDWHGVRLNEPDRSEPSHILAFTLRSLNARFLLHGMLNAYWEPSVFVPHPRKVGKAGGVSTPPRRRDDMYPWDKARWWQAAYGAAYRWSFSS